LTDLHKLRPSHLLMMGGMPNNIDFQHFPTLFPSGRPLLTMFKDSVYHLVVDSYPEHTWRPWRMGNTTNNYWKQLATNLQSPTFGQDPNSCHQLAILVDFVADLAEKYQIKLNRLEDWYSVDLHVSDARIVNILGGLRVVLPVAFTEYPWDRKKFDYINKRVAQGLLMKLATKQLPQAGA